MTTSDSPSKRHLVLAVDDEPTVLAAIVSALEANYTIYTARSGAEARSVLAQCLPDLIVLDVQLEDSDGLQLLAEFRQHSMAPALVVTGQGSEEVAARALRLRANDYLPKPFVPSELQKRVAALLAAGPRPEHLAERARTLIDSLLRQQVSAADLAERLQMEPRRLLRVFRDRFGRTPMEYLREARLQRAQELLLTTDRPIARIATEVGFRYVSYFDRAFKREFNVSPAEFRRSHRLPADPQSTPPTGQEV